jgi:hypothetical protein
VRRESEKHTRGVERGCGILGLSCRESGGGDALYNFSDTVSGRDHIELNLGDGRVDAAPRLGHYHRDTRLFG